MKLRWLGLVGLLMAMLVAVGCAPAKAPAKAQVPAGYKNLRILGGSLGGTSSTAAMAFAAVLNKYYPEIEWSSSSGGTVTNAIYIVKDTAKLANVTPSAFIDSYGFDKIPESRLRSIMLIYSPTQNFWLIRDDKPWTDITQVPKGTALSPGPAGGSALILSEAWVNLCGLSKKDFNWLPLAKTEQTDAWRSGKLDIVLGQIAGMAPNLMDMWTSQYKFKPMGLSPEQVARAKAEQTFERIGFEAPRKSNVTELVPELFKYDVFSVQQPNFMSARDDFPEDIAYRMAKVIDEHGAELATIFPAMKYATPQRHIEWARPPLGIHPGVARYYKERGYLK